jgi:hypothetical protein
VATAQPLCLPASTDTPWPPDMPVNHTPPPTPRTRAGHLRGPVVLARTRTARRRPHHRGTSWTNGPVRMAGASAERGDEEVGSRAEAKRCATVRRSATARPTAVLRHSHRNGDLRLSERADQGAVHPAGLALDTWFEANDASSATRERGQIDRRGGFPSPSAAINRATTRPTNRLHGLHNHTAHHRKPRSRRSPAPALPKQLGPSTFIHTTCTTK